MTLEDRQASRPLWVRLVVGRETKRSGALRQVSGFGILICVGLVTVGGASASSSLLGVLALWFGLVGTCCCAALAVWSWLAVRWVARHGKWA